MNYPSLRWILAYPIRGGGSSPRHGPAQDVCPSFRTTLIYRVLHRLAVLTDLKFKFMSLDPILFPDIPSDIEAHSGFVIEHMKTANWILAEVEQLMDEHSSTNVILVRLDNCALPGRRTYLVLIPVGRSLAWGSSRRTRHAVHDAKSACGYDHPRSHIWDAAGWKCGLGYVL
jgi:hypothetical protein